MGVFYGTKPIVSDGLVLCLDPANITSVSDSNKTDPINGIKDIINNTNQSTSYVHTSSFNPAWNSDNNGCVEFQCSNNSSSPYKYGYIDLGSPVSGKTTFGPTDSYTFEFWWKQKDDGSFCCGSGSYAYAGGQIYGPKKRYINTLNGWSSYDAREERHAMRIFTVQDGTSSTSYKMVFQASHIKYSSNYIDYQFTVGGTTGGIPVNEWVHLCGVMDLGDSIGGGVKSYCYQNGKLVSASTPTESGSGTISFAQNGNSLIGASSLDYNPTPNLRSNAAMGYMGPFKIYNKALTIDQVQQNYEALRDRYGAAPSAPIQSGNVDFVTSGTYSWEVPESVFSICAVCIGAGGGASVGGGGWSGSGGGGGALSYKNNISVTPGETLTIIVGAGGGGGFTSGLSGGDSQIKRSSTILLEGEGGNGGSYRSSGGAGGQTWSSADGGGDGGNGGTSTQNELFQDAQGGGGGGAGGYSGNGGNGGYGLYSLTSGYMIFPTNGSAGATGSGAAGGGGPSGGTGKGGGGVNIVRKGGTGSSASRNSHGKAGSGGTNSSESVGGSYGGGAGGEDSSGTADDGSGGAIRIIFGDLFTDTRTYPSV